MEDRREKDKGLKTGWLWTITAVLALLCCAAATEKTPAYIYGAM